MVLGKMAFPMSVVSSLVIRQSIESAHQSRMKAKSNIQVYSVPHKPEMPTVLTRTFTEDSKVKDYELTYSYKSLRRAHAPSRRFVRANCSLSQSPRSCCMRLISMVARYFKHYEAICNRIEELEIVICLLISGLRGWQLLASVSSPVSQWHSRPNSD